MLNASDGSVPDPPLRWCMSRAGEAGGVHDWQISRGKQIRGQKSPDRGGRPWDGELLGGRTDGEIVRQMSGMGGGVARHMPVHE